ncbi:hypothetical protein DL96DRAFT_1819830 [Flagelloscypha sp. PMI_526]|nr:hypothetical protein DL96DRAFT_1819830 [Flagelloscypha sp. PMI_526]
MSTPHAGPVQEPLLRSLPHPAVTSRLKLPKIIVQSSGLILYIFVSLLFTALSSFTFVSSVAMGRYRITYYQTHNPDNGSPRTPSLPLPRANGEYASAGLAGVILPFGVY